MVECRYSRWVMALCIVAAVCLFYLSCTIFGGCYEGCSAYIAIVPLLFSVIFLYSVYYCFNYRFVIDENGITEYEGNKQKSYNYYVITKVEIVRKEYATIDAGGKKLLLAWDYTNSKSAIDVLRGEVKNHKDIELKETNSYKSLLIDIFLAVTIEKIFENL